MNQVGFWCLGHVSDDELEAGLTKLLGAGARVEARIVAHLAEVEARRLDLLAGASSLYDYCKTRLGLSDYEAFVRIAAARVARRYPIVFEMLERRELHLTAICEVREFLTHENHRELLAEVSHKTKLQIREALARRFPQADVASGIRRLPNTSAQALSPLSAERYRLQLTLSRRAKEKLELARDLMSHANASGDLSVVIERALDLLIAEKQQRRFGKTKREHPRKPPTKDVSVRPMDSAKRQHIANSVRREVVERDGERCSFVSSEGCRCEARAFLQLHHRKAWALGGADTADNLQLLCRQHNRLAAEEDFGRELVASHPKRLG